MVKAISINNAAFGICKSKVNTVSNSPTPVEFTYDPFIYEGVNKKLMQLLTR